MIQTLQVFIALVALIAPMLLVLVLLILAERRDGTPRRWAQRYFSHWDD